uniref:Thioredoxin-T n=1 Tax=Aceria tosichella TaxID=561515 RepID=A0A6G1SE73_9ACAR
MFDLNRDVVNKSDLESKIAEGGDRLVAIHFYAKKPTNMMRCSLGTMGKHYKDRLLIVHANADALGQDVLEEYANTRQAPAFSFLRGGKKLSALQGENEEDYILAIYKHMNSESLSRFLG